ncbi:MAG TPA: hypothetical protein VK203_03070 [Nostocaceae cyanobacterium]|nr:hypothetical protein [Nostocaceae cyanobacterium]
MMEENLMIEQAKTIYDCFFNDAPVDSLGLALPWDDLTPEAQQRYINLANKLAIDVLAIFENTLFKLLLHENDPLNIPENEFYTKVIISRKQVEELYEILPVTDDRVPELLLSAVKLWIKCETWWYDFRGFRPMLEKIAQQTEGSAYNHSEVIHYARSMLKLFNQHSTKYFEEEIRVLLQSMTLKGLPHSTRSFLAKEILSLLDQDEERRRIDAENMRNPDWF